MYRAFRNLCEQLLRLPADPKAPPGDESSTRLFRAAPNFYKYLLVVQGLKIGVGLAALLAFGAVPLKLVLARHGWSGPVIAALSLLEIVVAVVGGAFALALLRLDYEKRWYLVTDRSLRIRQGVGTVKEMTVNFANIQNITVTQGPLERLLGIANLRVDTAGGGGAVAGAHGEQLSENLHTAWFRGIDNAGEVRGLIQERLGRLKDAGLGDHHDTPPPPLPPAPDFRLAAGLELLREIHREARALREALQQNRPSNT